MKKWKKFDDECISCGESPVYIYTDSDEDNYAYEDDEARCANCGEKGIVITYPGAPNTASVLWDEINIDKQ